MQLRSLDEAFDFLDAHILELDVEPISIQHSVGRILAQQVSGNDELKPGTLITPKQVAALTQMGCVVPIVNKLPRIGILVVGEKPAVSAERYRYEANGFQIRAILQAMALQTGYYGIIAEHELNTALSRAMHENQILLICGTGHALPPALFPALEKCCADVPINHLDMESGNRVLLTTHAQGVSLILPGNPIITLDLMDSFGKTCIHKLMGHNS